MHIHPASHFRIGSEGLAGKAPCGWEGAKMGGGPLVAHASSTTCLGHWPGPKDAAPFWALPPGRPGRVTASWASVSLSVQRSGRLRRPCPAPSSFQPRRPARLCGLFQPRRDLMPHPLPESPVGVGGEAEAAGTGVGEVTAPSLPLGGGGVSQVPRAHLPQTKTSRKLGEGHACHVTLAWNTGEALGV